MATSKPICFGCVHFAQYQSLHFRTPGECKWEPPGGVPEWLASYLRSTDRYYGPKREVSTSWPVLQCDAFKEKPNDR